jgi:hypothetical protein
VQFCQRSHDLAHVTHAEVVVPVLLSPALHEALGAVLQKVYWENMVYRSGRHGGPNDHVPSAGRDVLGKASFESLPGCRGLEAGCAAVCASTSLCMAARLEAGRSLRCSRGGQRCASSAGLLALYDS